jgi:molecular chaperone GrpE
MTKQNQEQTPVEDITGASEVAEQAVADAEAIETEEEKETTAAVDEAAEVQSVPEPGAGEAPVDEQEAERLSLCEQLEQAQAKVDEYLDGWQRARAEFANYRRREEQRRQQMEGTIQARVLASFLPVMDDLDRAFQAVPEEVCDSPWVEGLSLVGQKLQAAMAREGVSSMDVQPGDSFDPNYHQAVLHSPSPAYGEGQVVDVLQGGYMLGEMVLRPAMVHVSSGKIDECEPDHEESPEVS